MTTSLTTFENDLRQRLLDVVYSQWHDLGVPFSKALASEEVIDPEALLWCSLEFLPTEPRLCEGAVAWLRNRSHYLIRQRFNNWARGNDPRARIWEILETAIGGSHAVLSPRIAASRSLPVIEADGNSTKLDKFRENLAASLSVKQPTDSRIGRPVAGPSTLLLRARDLLGSDGRHFLLAYLLTKPGGGRLRDVQRWAGYSYRSTAETATRWQSAGVVEIDHGFCRLIDPTPWNLLLRSQAERIVLVDFHGAFEACIRLLHVLAKARTKNLGWNSTVVHVHRAEALSGLSSSILSDVRGKAASIQHLLDCFPAEEKVEAKAS